MPKLSYSSGMCYQDKPIVSILVIHICMYVCIFIYITVPFLMSHIPESAKQFQHVFFNLCLGYLCATSIDRNKHLIIIVYSEADNYSKLDFELRLYIKNTLVIFIILRSPVLLNDYLNLFSFSVLFDTLFSFLFTIRVDRTWTNGSVYSAISFIIILSSYLPLDVFICL